MSNANNDLLWISMDNVHSIKISVKQESIPVGCEPSVAVAMPIPACTGHCVSQHALGRRGVYPSMHWVGVSAQGGVYPGGGVSQHALRQTPPYPCGQNNRQV